MSGYSEALGTVFHVRLAAALPNSDRPSWEVELEVNAVSHAEIGAYLLGIWGMPYPIVEAVEATLSDDF